MLRHTNIYKTLETPTTSFIKGITINFTQSEIKNINKYFPDGLIALDLETSGLSPLVDEIIEIAAIKVVGNKIETFESLVKPKNPIPEFTTKIHGITDDMVKDSPSIEEVLPKFLEFSGNTPLVAHNAKFDIGFIVFAMHQQKIELHKAKVFCSCKLSRKYVKGSENHKLSSLCKHFEIPLKNHHRALDDTIACLRVFAKTLDEVKSNRQLKEGEILNIRDFTRANIAEAPEIIQQLQKKIANQEVIDIKYKGGSYKGKFRPIKPVALLPMPAGDVLYAHCLLTDIYKSFAIKKIQDLRDHVDKDSK